MKTTIAAAVAAALLSTAVSAQAAAPLYGFQLGDVSETLTLAEAASFLGAPDDLYTGLGAGFVTYDLGDFRLIDGAGQDFNVYEYNSGSVEFGEVDILVSADNINYFNVEGSFAAAVDLVGDELHTNPSFRRSYDVGAAVTALGVAEFRYIRLDGTGGGAIGGSNDFDPDSIAVINYVNTAAVVPEPATWAMMILGFGSAGSVIRRRRTQAA